MNVTELRIGNYVHNNVEPFPIKAKDLMFLLSFDNHHYAEPIPINEDWLKGLGFRKWPVTDSCFYIDSNQLRLVLFKTDTPIAISSNLKPDSFYYFFDKTSVTIDYVHQLQNLFYCLTGKELSCD